MITPAELNKAGAMVQRTDGTGWADLAKEHGDKVVTDAIVHLVKHRGQPAPLSVVKAYLRLVHAPSVAEAEGRKSEPQEAAPKKSAAPKITAPGMPNKIAEAIGVHNSSVYQWKKKDAIPAHRREAVEEVVRVVEAGGDLPTPRESKAKTKGLRRSSDSRVALEAVAKGLGIEVVPVYVIEGDRLVERQGVVW